MAHVYLLINKSNGHKYIGTTTKDTKQAWVDHINKSRRMCAKPIHRAIRKFGTHMFMLRELSECNESELDTLKKEFIIKYNTYGDTGYNVDHDAVVDIVPEEIKQDDTVWGFYDPNNRGNGKSSATKLMSVNIDTGEKRYWDSASQAAIELAGKANRCNIIIRAADNGYKAYGHRWKRLEPSKRRIKVYGVHKVTWEETRVFDSIKEASRIMGANENSIRKSVNNPHKNTCAGYYWFKA